MTSFFKDATLSATSLPRRGIGRVLVLVATLVGLAGLAGCAPGVGGDLRRDAAGVMPIVDAGNYVGTKLGDRLSNNGGMDLSWPRPEGFDGIWFEKEPIGRREHVVWESQRFVGRQVDIPKLRPGQAEEAFVGLPDICAPVVKQRMAELGYTDDPELGRNSEIRYSCNFANLNVKQLDRLDALDLSIGTPGADLEEITGKMEYQLPKDDQFVAKRGGRGASQCVVRGPVLKGTDRVYLATGAGNVESQYAMCTINSLYWQVIRNISGGF